jgi:hypothetical protein
MSVAVMCGSLCNDVVVIERNTPCEVTTYKVLNGITAGV